MKERETDRQTNREREKENHINRLSLLYKYYIVYNVRTTQCSPRRGWISFGWLEHCTEVHRFRPRLNKKQDIYSKQAGSIRLYGEGAAGLIPFFELLEFK